MSYEEKHNILSLGTLVLVTIPYLGYVFTKYSNETFPKTEDELAFWAIAILLIVPVRIVVEIIAHTVYAILNYAKTGKEDIDTAKDERDELIGLKATRNTFYAFSAAVMLGMLATAVTSSPGAMPLIILIGGTIAELVEIVSKIFYYRRGI